MKRKRARKRPPSPDLGRNFAIRPGAGPHKAADEKRAAGKPLREIDEQRDETRPSSRRASEDEPAS